MVQIKLSIAFVLAAAAIAPVVSIPIGERGGSIEARGVDGYPQPHHRHWPHHHHGRPHHRKQRHAQAPPTSEAVTTEAAPAPVTREYADEFDARDLLANEKKQYASLQGKVKKLQGVDSRLERTHKILEGENKHLRNTDKKLENKERRLKSKDRHLEHKTDRLRRTEHSLERRDKPESLLREKHRLTGDVHKFASKDIRYGLTRKPEFKKFKAHDNALVKKGGALAKENKVLEEGVTVAPAGARTASAPAVKSKGKLTAREFDDVFEDMFERDFEDVDFEARDFDDELYLD